MVAAVRAGWLALWLLQCCCCMVATVLVGAAALQTRPTLLS
jgi:hypothetical protein